MSEISNMKCKYFNKFIDCRYFSVENEEQGWLLIVKQCMLDEELISSYLDYTVLSLNDQYY
jgi:3-phenylpropionate/cinnamic acid dioxygenase small subunit